MAKIQMQLEDFDLDVICANPNVELIVNAAEAALFDSVCAASDGYEAAGYEKTRDCYKDGEAVIEHVRIEIEAGRSTVRPVALAIARRALKPVHDAWLSAAQVAFSQPENRAA